MAEDFRIMVGFFRHHKTLKLVRRLGLEGLVALLRLWEYAAEFRTRGDLAGMTVEDIELASGWNSEAPFVPVLVEIGFLDEGPDGYALHDWQTHNPWVAEAEERSDAARLSRLHRENPEAAARLKAEGRTGLTSEEYATFKRSTTVERPLTNRTTPAPAPEPNPKSQEKAVCPEPCPASGPSPSSPVAFTFPTVGKADFELIRQDEVDQWQGLFPGVDVPLAINACLAWNAANPSRRKTPAGVRRHIVSWLTREQNSGRGQGKSQAGLSEEEKLRREVAEIEAILAKGAVQ